MDHCRTLNFFNLMGLIRNFMGQFENLMGHVGNLMGQVGNPLGQTGNPMGEDVTFMGLIFKIEDSDLKIKTKNEKNHQFSLCHYSPKGVGLCSIVILMQS